MAQDTIKVQVDCTARAVDPLRALLAEVSQSGEPPRFVKRQNLDGDAATWIVLTSLSVQALSHLLSFLSAQLDRRTVKRFKVGTVEIENPTARDLELLRERLRADGTLSDEGGKGSDTTDV